MKGSFGGIAIKLRKTWMQPTRRPKILHGVYSYSEPIQASIDLIDENKLPLNLTELEVDSDNCSSPNRNPGKPS